MEAFGSRVMSGEKGGGVDRGRGTLPHSPAVPEAAPRLNSAGRLPYAIGAPIRVPSALVPHSSRVSDERAQRLLPLSGRSRAALAELARRYLAWLRKRSGALSPELLADAAWTAGTGRTHFSHRSGIVFRDAAQLEERLSLLAKAASIPEVRDAGSVAFLFTGQGSQWTGMGRDIYEREPVARAVLDRCERVFREERGESLLAVMFGESGSTGNLDRTEWTQPALYGLSCALTELWSSVGIRPDVVMGHSVGEVAAAACAGVFGIEEGMRFAASRGALMGALPEGGAMTAVFASEERVRSLIAQVNEAAREVPLDLAADNGAHQVVSGPVPLLATLEGRSAEEDIRTARLATSHAFHSALMEPVRDKLAEAAEKFASQAPSVPLVANVTGRILKSGEVLDGAYWRLQARAPVAFGASVRALQRFGVGVLVEIGPQAVLGPMAAAAWPTSGEGPIVLSSVGQDAGFIKAVAGAYEAGLPVSFGGLYAGERRRRVSLPTYPFQRRRYWVQGAGRSARPAGDPLLGVRHELAGGETVFDKELSTSDPRWLDEARCFGQVVAPGALYATQALASVGSGREAVFVDDVRFETPLVLGDGGASPHPLESARLLQFRVRHADESASRSFEAWSRGDPGTPWLRHALGRVTVGTDLPERSLGPFGLDELKSGLAALDVTGFYRGMEQSGQMYGPTLQAVTAVWSGPQEALGELTAPEGLDRTDRTHPVVLDACFHVCCGIADWEQGEGVWLPAAWDRLWVRGSLPPRFLCHARLRSSAAASSARRFVDLALYGEDGEIVGGVLALALERTSRVALLSAAAGMEEFLYELEWRERPDAEVRVPTAAAFLGSPEVLTSGARAAVVAEGEAGPLGPVEIAALDGVAGAYALRVLEELGWERRGGARVELEEVRRQLGIVEEHRGLLGRLLGMLEEGGLLISEEGGDGWLVMSGSEDPLPEGYGEPSEQVEELVVRHPAGRLELGLLRRCGEALSEVLRGRLDARAVLFGGSRARRISIEMHRVRG